MQFRLQPYIIYLILNLVHYLIETYFYHYYVPIIVLSLVGFSAYFPCCRNLSTGFHKTGKSFTGKWNPAKLVIRDDTVLNSVTPFLAYFKKKIII